MIFDLWPNDQKGSTPTKTACFLFDHSLFGGEDHFFELFGGDAQGLAFPFDDDDVSFRYFLFQIDATDI